MTPDFTLADADVRSLGERGWFLRDGVLGPAVAATIHEAVDALSAAGRLRPAGVSRGATYRVDGAVRGDAIAWLEPDEDLPGLRRVWPLFLGLRDALNESAYLGLDRMEVQVARYPGDGAAYARHRDAFSSPTAGPPSRRVTAIYYANPGWRREDGGMLRLHGDDGPLDVEPILDRLLVFMSERVEHEVLPARAPRRAVTAWFRPRDPLAR